MLDVENWRHELLPEPVVRATVADFLAGAVVRERRLRVDLPRFLSIEDARLPLRRPGQ